MRQLLRAGLFSAAALLVAAAPVTAIPLEPAAEPTGGVIDPTCTIPQSQHLRCVLQSLSGGLSG